MPKLQRTKRSTPTPLFTQEDIFKMAREYADLSAQIKVLEDRKSKLSAQIKDGAEKFGVKDDKGSFYLENDSFTLGKVSKKSFSIDQEKGVKTLESLGLGDVVDVVSVRTVNEDRLNNAVADGRVSLNVVESFTTCKQSFSVMVKPKETAEEMPDIQQSNLAAAARKK